MAKAEATVEELVVRNMVSGTVPVAAGKTPRAAQAALRVFGSPCAESASRQCLLSSHDCGTLASQMQRRTGP